MKQPQHSKNIHRHLLSLKERMLALGVQDDPLYQFDYELCLSPIAHVARKFIVKLDCKLGRLELNGIRQADESVPNLDPDSSIELGKTVGQKLPYRIKINDLTTHAIVCGASGSGKTNTISLIITSLLGCIRMILLDHKDEGLRFVSKIPGAVYIPPERQRWNWLASNGKQTDYIRFVCTQLAKLIGLLPVTLNAVQAKLLALCHDQNNLPAVSDLSDLFFALAKKDSRSSLFTAARGFDDLAISMGKWAAVRQGRWPFDDHLLSVVPLKDCPTAFEYFYISLLFKQLMDRASAHGHGNALKQLVVFDEGRGFFGRELEPGSGSGRINLQSDILTKARSYGIGNIIGTQSISSLQSVVVDNAGIFIALRTNSEQEAKACCRRLGFNDSRYMELINMPVGTAWVVSPQCQQPVKIKVPFLDLGDYPSETEIAQRMAPLWTQWDNETVFAPTKTEKEVAIDFRELLGEKSAELSSTGNPSKAVETEPVQPTQPSVQKPSDPQILSEYFALLRSCKAQPDFGASAHYKSLGWSGGRGNRVKSKILELEWIEVARVASPKGGRPKETLQITEKGKEVLNESA